MRLSSLERNNLTAEQTTVLKAIEQGPRGKDRPGIGLIGPFGAWVRSPAIGGAVQELGSVIRFSAALPDKVKEVAICTVGAYYHSKFEFSAHKSLALTAGVDEECLNQLQAGVLPAFTGHELLAYQIASQMLHDHGISDITYAAALEAFGETILIELVTTVGYYCLVSLTLNSFQIPLEKGMKDPFP